MSTKVVGYLVGSSTSFFIGFLTAYNLKYVYVMRCTFTSEFKALSRGYLDIYFFFDRYLQDTYLSNKPAQGRVT
jgi:hypothetical protein